MRYFFSMYARRGELLLAGVSAFSTRAQKAVWSEAPKTQQWSSPTFTQRRSDAEVQRQVDAITEDAERRAASTASHQRGPSRAGASVQEKVWRDHMDRTNAQNEFQRQQDEYYRRQQQFQAR